MFGSEGYSISDSWIQTEGAPDKLLYDTSFSYQTTVVSLLAKSFGGTSCLISYSTVRLFTLSVL